MKLDPNLEPTVRSLDDWIESHPMESHLMAGILLSRVIHLLSSDPKTGKFLTQHVWTHFDELEQENPNFGILDD